jgi:branched-subunit amino acid aminotransferase/4-amino-4-deoxychorismate lyase
MKEIVFLNDKFMPIKEAKLPVVSPAFLYGWGLFESMRSYRDKIIYFKEHLMRIKDSCRLMDMEFPYPPDKLKKIIKKTVKINGFKDAYVRLTLWKSGPGTVTLITARKYKPYSYQKYRQGLRACICPFRQNEDSFFTRIKTTSYLLYRLAYLKAKDKGFDEAVILNNRGYIAEGSRSNIFLIKDNELFTPALECGCLAGTTRKAVFDLAKKYNIKIYEGNFTLQDLYRADGAFLTNSLMGIMPLASVEKHRLAKGVNSFKLTGFLIKKYNHLLKNGT